MALFNRTLVLTVGTVKLSARTPGSTGSKPTLRVAFVVSKDSSSAPNKVAIQIWNLAQTTRDGLKEKTLPVTLEAGYVDETSVLFKGDLRFGSNKWDGIDWITTVEAGDGAKNIAESRMLESFKKGTTTKEILKRAVDALGVGIGNLQSILTGEAASDTTKKGFVAEGKARDVVDKICRKLGVNWTIRDGEMQILGPTDVSQETEIVLSPTSGLIGSPEIGEKGIVKAKSLLQGELNIGRRVVLQSRDLDGRYRIEKIQHSGDTWGQDWYTELEAKPL